MTIILTPQMGNSGGSSGAGSSVWFREFDFKYTYPSNLNLRPGEKLHEVLATAEEMAHAEDHGDFYSFPRWTAGHLPELEAQQLEPLREYGSYNCQRLDLEQVVALLRSEGCIVPEGYGIGPNVEGA